MSDIEQTVEQVAEAQQIGESPGAAALGDSAADARLEGDGPAEETLAGPGAEHPGEDEDALQGDVDELVELAAQRDEYLALAQRTQADFENYRKRVARESALARNRGIGKLAKELLPALDNLDRALEDAGTAEGEGQDEPLLAGVRLVRTELGAALARMGIESFSPVGERFDPSEHEAMAQQAVQGAESGTVVEVYQAGYRLGEEILRPARVVVAA